MAKSSIQWNKKLSFLILFITLVSAQIKTGLDVLVENKFDELKGKHVGLITNQTGVNKDLISNIKLMKAANVDLKVVFAPEHGLSGAFLAGKNIKDDFDSTYNVKVVSLYGKNRKPSPEMLKNIDLLIYDIQDIGSRSYTYISTLGLSMEASAEAGIDFMVLDRPNPLGGLRIEGNILEPEFKSFIGQYEIPYIYGLTVGELSLYIKDEMKRIKNLASNLKVIKMKGWNRSMIFEKTGLHWIPTSPHIPDSKNAFFYSATGLLGELGTFNNGVGYTLPFMMIGSDKIDSKKILAEFNRTTYPYLSIRPVEYIPYYGAFKDIKLQGVQIYINSLSQIPSLIEIQFLFLEIIYRTHSESLWKEILNTSFSMFDKALGTDKISNYLKRGEFHNIKNYLNKDISKFRKMVTKYYLYN